MFSQPESSNTTVHEAVAWPFQNKAVANQRSTCECVSTVPSWRKSLLVLIPSPWTAFTWLCNETEVDVEVLPWVTAALLSASLVQAEQSSDLQLTWPSQLKHITRVRSIIILFKFAQCMKETWQGIQHFWWRMNFLLNNEFRITVQHQCWNAAEEDLICTKWQMTRVELGWLVQCENNLRINGEKTQSKSRT